MYAFRTRNLMMVVAGLLLFSLLGIALMQHAERSRRRTLCNSSFDEEVWQAKDSAYGPFPSKRQAMLPALVNRLDVYSSFSACSKWLGRSVTASEMTRYAQEDLSVGNFPPEQRNGTGHYYDEYDWDLIYTIGDSPDVRLGQVDPAIEMLVLRFSGSGNLESLYVVGGDYWESLLTLPTGIKWSMRR